MDGTNYGWQASNLAYEIVYNDIKEDNTSQYEKMDEVNNQNTTFTKTTPEQLMAISGS